jgi:hypothetical protein
MLLNMKGHNDNETYVSIGLAAALILNKLRLATQLETTEQKHEDKHPDRGDDAANEKRDADRRQYVQKRLADLREFERRANNLVRR